MCHMYHNETSTEHAYCIFVHVIFIEADDGGGVTAW